MKKFLLLAIVSLSVTIFSLSFTSIKNQGQKCKSNKECKSGKCVANKVKGKIVQMCT